MWFINKNVYLIEVKVVGHPFGGLGWDPKQSNHFITKFKVNPSDDLVMITDVECQIISCIKITSISEQLDFYITYNMVSFLKRTILFDDYTICKRVKLNKLKKMLGIASKI